jgi:hypothetical protein
MAIFHYSIKVIGRTQGRSAVAAAAYRGGEKIQNERDGIVHDYTKKKEVAYKQIMAPSHAPEWVYDRSRLWNEVEKVEKRKDAQLAKEIEVALPRELNRQQQVELLKDYIHENFVAKGMIADVCLHDKGDGNPHAHIMLTTRDITPEGFGKKNRSWNPEFAKEKHENQAERRSYLELNQGFVKSAEQCVDWRASWSEFANRALKAAGYQERIDHRSYEEQGVDLVPTIHEGAQSRQMEKRGIRTDRGGLNREIRERNATVIALEQYKAEKQAIEQKLAVSRMSTSGIENERALLVSEKSRVTKQAQAVKTALATHKQNGQSADIRKLQRHYFHLDKLVKDIDKKLQLLEAEYQERKAMQSEAPVQESITKEKERTIEQIESEINKLRRDMEVFGKKRSEKRALLDAYLHYERLSIRKEVLERKADELKPTSLRDRLTGKNKMEIAEMQDEIRSIEAEMNRIKPPTEQQAREVQAQITALDTSLKALESALYGLQTEKREYHKDQAIRKILGKGKHQQQQRNRGDRGR